MEEIKLTEEEKKMMEDIQAKIRKEMEKVLFEGIAVAAAEAPSLYMAKPLSKEDFDRFREEWEKALNEAPGWAQIKPVALLKKEDPLDADITK